MLLSRIESILRGGGKRGGGKRDGEARERGEATRGRLEPKIKAPRSPSQTGTPSVTDALFVS